MPAALRGALVRPPAHGAAAARLTQASTQVRARPTRLLTRICQFAQLLLIPALKSPLSVFLADGLDAGFLGSGRAGCKKGFAVGFGGASKCSGSSQFPSQISSLPCLGADAACQGLGLPPRSPTKAPSKGAWKFGQWGSSLKKGWENQASAVVRVCLVSHTRAQPNAMLFWSWPYIINNNNCKILLPTTCRLK